jgi:SAM-dependent methyltransferase
MAMTVGRRAYDLMYRIWAPWDTVGVRDDLRKLLATGQVSPASHPRAIDLGCGTGANVVFLAEQGYDVTGVDFSAVALRKARARAERAGVADRCTFVEADLTVPDLPAPLGGFDLLVDFSTLDDLDGAGRRAMSGVVARLARPGAVFLFYCFYGAREELPPISFRGPSRLTPAIAPGETEALFGDSFDVEPFSTPEPRTACFLLRRRPDGAGDG